MRAPPPVSVPLHPNRPSTVSSPADIDPIYSSYFNNSTAPRIYTDIVLVESLRKAYPTLHLTIFPAYSVDLLAYAASGHAHVHPSATEHPFPSSIATPPQEPLPAPDFPLLSSSGSLKWRQYLPPPTRTSPTSGSLVDTIRFGRYIYTHDSQNYIVYIATTSEDGYTNQMCYLLGVSADSNDQLLLAAGSYFSRLRNQVLVFDSGYWHKNHQLWSSVQSSSWDDVILDPKMKSSIVGEINKFFSSQSRYKRLKVPWKRGLIFHGPPGNGKTISVKAMMHTLYSLPEPIPTLYVRSLAGFGGPESSINSIFSKAREQSPCLLVFEDLDSLITDSVRSYFLNEVDGLESNDGILMLGSTNHIERLDPGIAKRPSRFDRKYLFPEPGMEERIRYAEFWRRKLVGRGSDDGGDEKEKEKEEEEIEFPHHMCKPIAAMTQGFSFAYIQEAFVASLLAIAEGEEVEMREAGAEEGFQWEENYMYIGDEELAFLRKEDDELEKYVLWRQMKMQVRILREELEGSG
ncbi:MAG: hypothetical protein Q9190_000531 [Brigantiaea leucoxantha]